jgi:pimeloyl-ACP methyl ester carboxylesterase
MPWRDRQLILPHPNSRSSPIVASDATGAVIPNSGHWLMEEQPAATVAAVRAFLDHD